MYGSPVGTTNITSSTQVIPQGYKGRVFNINFMAAGTSTTVKLLTGGSGGTVLLQEQSTGSNPKTVDYGIQGQLFDDGVFVLVDAQVTRVTLALRQEEKNTA